MQQDELKKTICIVSSYPLSMLRGGLDIQAIRTYEEMSVSDAPFHYSFFDWGSTKLADAYHFFGAPPHLWEIIESVREARRPYIVHLLSGDRQTFLNAWLRDQTKRRLGMRSNSSILGKANLVAMITENERDLLSRAYSLDRAKTAVIPNFVDEVFYDARADIWVREKGDSPFLLCVGMVQLRKNQLLLAKAANAAKLPLVLIGASLPGELKYAEQVDDMMRDNARYGGEWIKGLAPHDPLLISAHAACKAYVLLSNAETQPLSVLQAMASKKPVLLGKSFYTKSPPFNALPHQVNLGSFEDICNGLKQVWHGGVIKPLSEEHRTSNVTATLALLHARLFKNGAGDG